MIELGSALGLLAYIFRRWSPIKSNREEAEKRGGGGDLTSVSVREGIEVSLLIFDDLEI